LKKNLELPNLRAWLGPCVVSIFLALQQNTWADVDLSDAEKALRTQQYQLAFELYLVAAESGDGEAQYRLANLYRQGTGVDKSDEMSQYWLKAAAENSYAPAQYNLALSLLTEDYDSAMALLQNSADSAYAPAIAYLDKLTTPQANALNEDPGNLRQYWFGSARNGQLEKMQEIFGQTENIDLVDENGRTALSTAILSGNRNVVEWLLRNNANPNHRDQFESSPIFVAIENGDPEIFELLIESNGNLRQTLPNGDTPLHFSIRRGQTMLSALLLEQAVDLNVTNGAGTTALDLAEDAKQSELTTQLVSNGAIHGTAWYALHLADRLERQATGFSQQGSSSQVDINAAAKIILGGNTQLLRNVLTDNSQLLQQHLPDGSTLFSLAVKENLSEILAILLLEGANPNEPVFNGTTPLQIAARENHLEVIKQLLDAGADPLLKNNDNLDAVNWSIQEQQVDAGLTLLDWLLNAQPSQTMDIPIDNYLLAAAQYDAPAIVDRLLPHANNEVVDDSFRNALWFASANRNETMVGQLIEMGISTSTQDYQGETPFHIAVKSNCQRCAMLLLPHSNIDQQTLTGNTALMLGISNASSEMIEWLLRRGADTEVRNNQGNSAIIAAVELNLVDIAQLLIDAGTNITRKNNLGYSALDIAERVNPELHEKMKQNSFFGLF